MQQHRALILRSNRFLASSLFDEGLISNGNLNAANEMFMGAIQSHELLKTTSLLSILISELKVLDEAKLLDHLFEQHSLGIIDLNYIELSSLPIADLDMSLCRASLSLPFDKVDGIYMVATCYYMSTPVVKHWEALLNGKIIWYATSMASMHQSLERLESFLTAKQVTQE